MGRGWCSGLVGLLLVACGDEANEAPPLAVDKEPDEAPACALGADEPNRVVALTAANDATCALDLRGQVYCWGDNVHNQGLRPYDRRDLERPTRAWVDTCMTRIVLRPNRGCGLDASGTALCWGNNAFGDVSTNLAPVGYTPVEPIEGLGVVVDVADGAVLTADGETWLWGRASKAWWPDYPPTRLPGEVLALQTGGLAHCAINRRRRVGCWGSTGWGKTGQPNNGEQLRELVEVPGLGEAVQVASGSSRACARLADGTVWCWGEGPLGDGEPEGGHVPRRVLHIEDARWVELSTSTSCAVDGDGVVFCWGGNSGGQLGFKGPASAEPVRIFGVAAVARVTVGLRHVCALTERGAVYCWGSNTFHQLGQGHKNPSTTPLHVTIPLEP